MDLINEAYRESLIIEAFKSSLLTKIFKASANKKVKARYWDKDKADAEGYMKDANFMNRLKQDIGNMLKQLDLSNVPDNAVIELDKQEFRKKANKKQYRSVIFTDDNYLPIFYASFYDDGTINYVSTIGEFQRRGEATPKLSWVMSDDQVTKAIVVADYEKYFNAGVSKNKERWMNKGDALALHSNADILNANINRYKKMLVDKKSKESNFPGEVGKLIDAFTEVSKAFSKMNFSPKAFENSGVSSAISFLKSFNERIDKIQRIVKDLESGSSWRVDDKKQVDVIMANNRAWLKVANNFIENGELDKSSRELLSKLRR
jgi:hypothetical protein